MAHPLIQVIIQYVAITIDMIMYTDNNLTVNIQLNDLIIVISNS